MSGDYSELTDCPICPMLATDRDDALQNVTELQAEVDRLQAIVGESWRENAGRPFAEFRDSGLLWLMNRVVFHPRGYALALHYHSIVDGVSRGDAVGWSLLGDGTEPWSMGDAPVDQRPVDYQTEDELFTKIKELLA